MSDVINEIIEELYGSRWSGDLSCSHIDKKREQLYKTLRDQTSGYWSGHTAYYIAVDGGFLKDAKRQYLRDSNRCKGKELTALGKIFFAEMEGKS